MLCKQGWRLIQNPGSLVSRIFKARYYSSGSFLEAELGSNPSFIWRSILATQSILRQGVRRRIGNGSQTLILKEPWLPCLENPYITSSHPSLQNQLVQSLLLPSTFEWDTELIAYLFNSRDAGLILSISLRNSHEDDKWLWAWEKSGAYSVKSTYRFLHHQMENELQQEVTKLWSVLWSLKVPPKVRSFLWRANSGCLPTRFQLLLKGIQLNSKCPLCGAAPETILHILVYCEFAKACWFQAGFHFSDQYSTSFGGWLEQYFASSSMEICVKFAMISWAIWKVRNDFIWKQKGARISNVLFISRMVLANWEKVQEDKPS